MVNNGTTIIDPEKGYRKMEDVVLEMAVNIDKGTVELRLDDLEEGDYLVTLHLPHREKPLLRLITKKEGEGNE